MVRSNRAGFTLVELLVVIAIIAVLTGLLLVGVQTARKTADVYTATSDFNQLNTAISGFKSTFKRYPACTGDGPMGTFRLASYYMTRGATGAPTYVPGYSDSSAEIKFLRAVFGRINLLDTGLRRGGVAVAPDANMDGESDNLQTDGILPTAPALLDPNQCMVVFLTGGTYTEYLGYSSSPSQPFASPATASSQRLQGTPFMDITKAKDRLKTPMEWLTFRQRYISINALPSAPAPAMDGAASMYRWEGTGPLADTITTTSNEPWYLDPWGTPYLYLSTSGLGSGGDYPATPILIGPWGGKVSGYNRNPALAGFPALGVTAFKVSAKKFENHSGFQIISAGPNGSAIRNDIPWGFGYNPTPAAPIAYGTADFGKGNTGGGDDYVNFRGKALGEID